MRKLLLGLILAVLPISAFAQSHPVFFNDAPSLARYAAMKANYDANPAAPSGVGGQIYKYVKFRADNVIYGDNGVSASYIYHWSGDSTYAQLAYSQATYLLNQPDSCTVFAGNYIREYGWQFALMYDFIYTGLDAGQRAAMLSKINYMMGCVTGASFRGGDSDQTTGEYMMEALWFKATGDYNATAATIWNDATRKIGGFTATSADLSTTRRNAVSYYITVMSVGGEFLESTDYNNGTCKIVLIPYAALKTAGVTLTDIDAWVPDAALSAIHIVSPGVATATRPWPYMTQDTEGDKDNMQGYYRLETDFTLAGVAKGTSSGPYIQDFTLDYLSRGPLDSTTAWNGAYVYPRGFLVFDPDAPRGDHTTLDKFRYNSGKGLWLTRTGWSSSDSMFGVYMEPGPAFIDHKPFLWGEFQLWKNQKWAIRHPTGYGGPPYDCRGSNTICIEGLDTSLDSGGVTGCRQYRSIRAYRNDFTNGFHYIVGTIGGARQGSGAYNPEQTSLHEDTRSFVYLSNWDVVIVYDRVNSDNLVTNANTGTALAAWINSQPRVALYVHSPVTPTLSTGKIRWDYATGEGTTVSTLLPTGATRTVEDESTLWPTIFGKGQPNTYGFDVKVVPSSDIKWNTLLNVWDAHGSGSEATVSLVQDVPHAVDATLVTKGNQSVLAAFNGIQGADIPLLRMSGGFGYWQSGVDTVLNTVHLRTSDYSLTWNSAVPTKALLFDLNNSISWTYTINGGASTPLTVDSNGIGVIDIAVTGDITLAMTGGGPLNPPTLIDTTMVPDCVVGVAYSKVLSASLGDGGPYTWSVNSGALPDALSLSAGGTVSGTCSGVTDNSLTKTASSAWGNAGAYSTNSLAAGDGYVQSVAAETSTYRMFGLSNGNTDNGFADIDYAIYLTATPNYRVLEGGVLKYTSPGAYAAGDTFKVAVVSGEVKYYRNGTLFYTSLTAPTYPLIVDTALYDLGSTLKNLTGTFGAGVVNVAWAAVTGATQGSGGSTATYEVKACDGAGTPSCATQSFTMNVLATPTITTASLDAGVVGTAYSDSCAAVGGTEPYTFTVVGGGAPCHGLTLSSACVIAGIPTTVGTCSFTIHVEDAGALVSDKAFEIPVTSALQVMTMSCQPGSTSVVCQYGTPNLADGDSCTISLLNGETVQATSTQMTGAASRTATFTGLLTNTTYGVDGVCGTAVSNRAFFQTLSPSVNTGTYRLYLRPFSKTVTQMGAGGKVAVMWKAPGESDYTATRAACTTSCVVTMSGLATGNHTYYIAWETSAAAVVASSARVPATVAIR